MNCKAWLVAAVAVTALLLAGFSRLHLDADVLNLLPADLPAVEGLRLYQRNFSEAQELIVTVRGPDAAKTKNAARQLATVLRAETNLTSSVVWQPFWMEEPVAAAELIGFMWLNQSPSQFGEMAARLSGTNIAATLTEAREQLATSFSPMEVARRAYDPYNLLNLPESVSSGAGDLFGGGRGLFESADGTFRVIFVQARPDISNYRAGITWFQAIKAMVQSARDGGQLEPEISLGFTGGPAFSAEIASGMEHDMTASVFITSVIIAILFWLFHRRWLPMVWLLVLLAVILACTMALGGLIFGTINFVSLGFAGILLGLAVDYGVVHYQEALASPNAIIPEIRRAIGPSIFWAAVTTISAFLVLNFGGMPGLAQLGSLVALGVMLSALVMLFAFLPPLFRDRTRRRLADATVSGEPAEAPADAPKPGRIWPIAAATALLLVFAVAVLVLGRPKFDETANALRPRNSAAYATLTELQKELSDQREPLWLIARGRDELETARRLEAANSILERATASKVVSAYVLPTPLWPRPDHQAANRLVAAGLVAERETLRKAAREQSFGPDSLKMTDGILDTWQRAMAVPGTYWPSNETSRWILRKVAARQDADFLAAGLVYPAGNEGGAESLSGLSGELKEGGLILSGWPLLGPSLLQRVRENLWKLVAPMAALVLLSLWLAFRRWTEILLSAAVLALSGLCLLAVMRLAGWSWNPLNLMGLPLILGTGVDYSIFMQLALRRHRGSLAGAHFSVGRALLLCGGTAVAGFGSLSLSNIRGMASLGQVCAIGIAFNMLISVFLLPVWWRLAGGESKTYRAGGSAPSSLYRPGPWRLGLLVTRIFPSWFSAGCSHALTTAYWIVARHRREIVIANLLPVLGGSREAAERKGRELLRQFATKVAHLMRYESGQSIDHLFGEWTGWEHFKAAQAQRRGILLVTPHLGNWEFGAPLLTRHGVKLQVITLAEPGRGFTELRRDSRARWDIDTLVVGDDPFASVEIIRRLEAGATVALLMDRPPATSRVTVEMFGRPFGASIAAAELARASGCVLLPVYLPLTDAGYAAHILPPIEYNRAALRGREARQKLTQQIMSVFEEPIRRHPDQWYHFVPVWGPPPTGSGGNERS